LSFLNILLSVESGSDVWGISVSLLLVLVGFKDVNLLGLGWGILLLLLFLVAIGLLMNLGEGFLFSWSSLFLLSCWLLGLFFFDWCRLFFFDLSLRFLLS